MNCSTLADSESGAPRIQPLTLPDRGLEYFISHSQDDIAHISAIWWKLHALQSMVQIIGSTAIVLHLGRAAFGRTPKGLDLILDMQHKGYVIETIDDLYGFPGQYMEAPCWDRHIWAETQTLPKLALCISDFPFERSGVLASNHLFVASLVDLLACKYLMQHVCSTPQDQDIAVLKHYLQGKEVDKAVSKFKEYLRTKHVVE